MYKKDLYKKLKDLGYTNISKLKLSELNELWNKELIIKKKNFKPFFLKCKFGFEKIITKKNISRITYSRKNI